jgi:DNA helicase HerA-like ATPase
MTDNKMADTGEKIFIGKGEQPAWLTLALGNRHGLVTGATGTGKTVSLQVMAEGFARAGVPVFAADIKGDLSGIAEVGEPKDFIVKRATEMGLTFQPDQFSTVFWDVFGEQGHPVRATVTEMGPLLLSRMLDLNDVQEGVLNVAFRVADENGLTLIDMKDLRSLLDAIVPDTGKKSADDGEDPLASIRKAAQAFGNVTKATVGTIQRQLLVLENQGASKFFGEPALTLKDFMKTDSDGRGMVNILVADKLMQSPRLYSTFLLWMLSELFEELPEVGDLPKPKLVFFFDEAHLLFTDAPKALMDKIEQVVRLIRSKGVGVYFITQSPLDVPESVLGQLSNRVQHALRAFTPKDQKAVKTAADTFRPNPKFKAVDAIVELGVGEALVSFLDTKGVPEPVERCFVAPPRGRIGPATDAERAATIKASPLAGKYEQTVDRESAYEVLMGRATGGKVRDTGGASVPTTGQRRRGQYDDMPPPIASAPSPVDAAPPASDMPRPQPRLREAQPPAPPPPPKAPARRSDTMGEAIAKSAARTVTNIAVREASKAIFGSGRNSGILSGLVRGVLGGLVK